MKAVNIKWDTDEDMEVFESLPTEIEIPEDVVNGVEDMDNYNDEIGDYISDVTGFCHYVFELVD